MVGQYIVSLALFDIGLAKLDIIDTPQLILNEWTIYWIGVTATILGLVILIAGILGVIVSLVLDMLKAEVEKGGIKLTS